MKKLSRRVLAMGTAAVLLGCTPAALAADTSSAISVQLDGKDLTFTDAAPQVKDQRTFLPFRAVLEAMGAEVSNEGSTITAVRGGKTLTMTIGSAEAKLTEGGKETTLTMDVAPYVDAANWRTYVPVRFAAEAFDCAVGWDQDTMTAVIVDTDKLLDQAKEGNTFTYLEKYLDYAQKYQTGIWNTELALDGSMTMMGSPIAIKGSASGTMADTTKLSMGMNMTMDMTKFIAQMKALSEAQGETATPISAEDQAMFDSLAKDGISMQMRGDMAGGKLYMNMSGKALETAGISSDVWYSMDLAALTKTAGIDFTALMDASKAMNYEALAKMALQSADLSDSTSAYTTAQGMAKQVASFLSDSAFVKNGNDCTTTASLTEGSTKVDLSLTLTTSGDKVVGYSMNLGMTAAADQEDTSAGSVTMNMTSSMDAKDQMKSHVTMDMMGFVSMDLNMTGGYTKGDKAPETEPPTGATVVPYESLLAPKA
ncbi:MAG: stalk domain-containing protein [Pseudoflavonifractor sp.]|nr:stalk domain-containing protein [Pseudoflavonifractor sp.]